MRRGHAIGAALGSGLLLFVSDYPVHGWPVQAVALVPVLVALMRWCRSTRWAAVVGFAMGLAYVGPLAVALEFPVLMGAALALYLALVWALWGALAHRLLAWPAPLGAVAVAAMTVVLEWAQYSLVPVWGTAQSFVRVWTAWPGAIQFAAVAGVTGVVFAVVATQALGVTLALAPARRALTAGLLAAVIALPAAYDVAALWRKPDASRRVAVIGWTQRDLDARGIESSRQRFEQVYRPLAERAAADGADLIVSPEVGFVAPHGAEDVLRGWFADLARRHRVALAVGYFHVAANENRVALFDETGALAAEYTKTHLIPLFEEYAAGDGSIALLHAGEDHPIGAMICQDDNFTDVARAYGRAGAALVVVPTNDWLQVKDHHFENSLFRGIENGYAVARAASNGISAIVDPTGRVLARADHFETGPKLLVADVPLGEGRTIYSGAGPWLPVLCAVLLAVAVAARHRRRSR